MAVLLLCVAVALVCWFVLFRVRRRRLYELADKLPGPPQVPLGGHVHRFMGDTQDIMTSIKEFSFLATHQGGLTKIWIGPMFFCMLTDAMDIDYVLKSCLDKDRHFTHFMAKIVGNGIFFAPLSIWRRRRKVMAPAFSLKNLNLLVGVFQEQSLFMVKGLQSKVGVGAFNAFPYFSSYTLKSIFEAGLGIKPEQWSAEFDYALSVMSQLLQVLSKRLFLPWLQPDWIFRLTPYYKIYNGGINYAYRFADKVIKYALGHMKAEEAKKTEADRDYGTEPERAWKPFINFVPLHCEGAYSDLELREEVLSLSIAGTDTSAVGSSFTLLMLGKHQDVQEKVYQELLDVFGASERPLVKEDLPKLCYLERVIKETLRLYPPVPIIARESSKEITLPSGKIIPAGCPMQVSIWGAQRNCKYWGADAEIFRPDRFDPELNQSLNPQAFLAFSAGPRNCIGYQYALMSMKTSISTILRRYRVTVGPADSGEENIPVCFEIMLKPARGFNVIVEPREKK